MSSKQVMQWFSGWYDWLPPTTEVILLGERIIQTNEWQNVESILSTDFSCKRSVLFLNLCGLELGVSPWIDHWLS